MATLLIDTHLLYHLTHHERYEAIEPHGHAH